jgi:hypothetical protein
MLFAKLKRRTFRIRAMKLPTVNMQTFADKFPLSCESIGTKKRFIRIIIKADSGHFSNLKDITKQTIIEKA